VQTVQALYVIVAISGMGPTGEMGPGIAAAATHLLEVEVASQQFNPGNARSGRVYNAYNCGKNNFEADRALAGQVVAVAPDAAGRAADLAGFALAAAAVMAASVGQLVDIGAGTPAGNSVYRVARRVNPGTRLVGVDHDPVVLAHLRAEAGDRAVIDADVRDVAVLLRGLDAMVDWSQPLGVMLCAVLHFVADHEVEGLGPHAIAEAVISRLAPGSLVTISHACCTGADPDVITGISAAYERHGRPAAGMAGRGSDQRPVHRPGGAPAAARRRRRRAGRSAVVAAAPAAASSRAPGQVAGVAAGRHRDRDVVVTGAGRADA
jgi:hypothetical protein